MSSNLFSVLFFYYHLSTPILLVSTLVVYRNNTSKNHFFFFLSSLSSSFIPICCAVLCCCAFLSRPFPHFLREGDGTIVLYLSVTNSWICLNIYTHFETVKYINIINKNNICCLMHWIIFYLIKGL